HSPFFSRFERSQFTTKSLFVSVQVRVVLIAVRMMGFISKSLLVAGMASMYLPRLTFNAVLPLPNRSYATPTRGVTSIHDAPSVDRAGESMILAQAAFEPGPQIVWSG